MCPCIHVLMYSCTHVLTVEADVNLPGEGDGGVRVGGLANKLPAQVLPLQQETPVKRIENRTHGNKEYLWLRGVVRKLLWRSYFMGVALLCLGCGAAKLSVRRTKVKGVA